MNNLRDPFASSSPASRPAAPAPPPPAPTPPLGGMGPGKPVAPHTRGAAVLAGIEAWVGRHRHVLINWALVSACLLLVCVIFFGRGEDDGPAPAPPKPDPRPAPTADVDPKIRALAVKHFGAFAARYDADRAAIRGGKHTYNDLMKAQQADIKAKGDALGDAIDGLVKPLVDGSSHFKDKAESERAYKTISASLAAGIRDAGR